MRRGDPAAKRRPCGSGRVVRAAVAALLVAALGVFHIWSRTRVVAAGYRLGQLQAEHTKLVSEQDRLRMEVETLRAPRALEEFARTRLGMAPPDSGPVWAGTAGKGGGVHLPGPAEPSLSDVGSGRAAAGPAAVPGQQLALRGPLRAGRTPQRQE